MITITETVVATRRLEPTYVRYEIRQLEPERLKPVRFEPVRRPFRPLIAGLYGTNRSPRDRMRHDDRWYRRKVMTVRYTAIDPRWR